LVEVLRKIKATQDNVLDTLKSISTTAFALDQRAVEGVVEGLKDCLRTASGQMTADQLKTVQNNLRMVTALRNFKNEVDPILMKLVNDQTEAEIRLAKAMRVSP